MTTTTPTMYTSTESLNWDSLAAAIQALNPTLLVSRPGPGYSPPWMGRCFEWDDGVLSWGDHYAVKSEGVVWDDMDKCAADFLAMLREQKPELVATYAREVCAMANYLDTERRIEACEAMCGRLSPEFKRLELEWRERQDQVMSVVFEAATPTHGLNSGFLDSDTDHGGRYSAARFADECDVYIAYFAGDWTLLEVRLEGGPTVWETPY